MASTGSGEHLQGSLSHSSNVSWAPGGRASPEHLCVPLSKPSPGPDTQQVPGNVWGRSWTDGRKEGRMGGWMADRWMVDWRMDGWMDRQTGGW